jgi:hypothetical protein
MPIAIRGSTRRADAPFHSRFRRRGGWGTDMKRGAATGLLGLLLIIAGAEVAQAGYEVRFRDSRDQLRETCAQYRKSLFEAIDFSRCADRRRGISVTCDDTGRCIGITPRRIGKRSFPLSIEKFFRLDRRPPRGTGGPVFHDDGTVPTGPIVVPLPR